MESSDDEISANEKLEPMENVVQENLPDKLPSPTLPSMESTKVEESQSMEAADRAELKPEKVDVPVKRKRGRPPKQSPGESNADVPPKKRRVSTKSVRPSFAPRFNAGHGISLSVKETRPYFAILDSMFSRAEIPHSEAASKWMKKTKCTPDIVAYSFVEAIKRHNAESWISNQLRMVNQAGYGESLTQRILASRGYATGAAANATPATIQPLSRNDRKLAELLETLVSEKEEWRNVYELMFTEIKWQLTSSPDLALPQIEALRRWSFYLCAKEPSEIAYNTVREILLATIRQDDQCEKQAEQQRCHVILNVYLTLAMVWPDAFKRIIINGHCVSDRVLRLALESVMWKRSSKYISQRFLKRCLNDAPFEFPTKEPDFTFIIGEQLHRLSTVALEFHESDSGLRLSPDLASCINILLLIAPYCNDKALEMFIEPSLTSVLTWNEITTNGSADQGDQKKFIFDILWLSKVTPFYQEDLARRLDELLALMRSVLDVGSSQIGISENKFLITCAASEFLSHLPLGTIPGKVESIRDLLKDTLAIFDQKADEGNRSIEIACRKFYKDFCSRHEIEN